MAPKPKSWKKIRRAAATQRRLVPQAAAGSAVAQLSKTSLTVMDHAGKIIRNDGTAPAGMRSRNAPQDSKFLALPEAVRKRIYQHVFDGLTITMPPKSASNRTARYPAPGILLACRLIIREANPVFYATATFYFVPWIEYRLKAWLKRIGPGRRAWLKNIHLGVQQPSWGDMDAPKEVLQGQAQDGEAKIERYRREFELESGVLKTELYIDGTFWSSSPKELVAAAHWAPIKCWHWIKEPSEAVACILKKPYKAGGEV
ncbi:Hypothetical predicted protein [Lecanosticta acicola]|uniref:Uncharacterized protein n=1 Tax=Lecanosticta acicola TaxID=111012 RepID=A0AAI8YVR2_9PEZI|nr:Hypothetical predicted protein [Lecanosticta acicola]